MLDLVLQITPLIAIGCIAACIFTYKKYNKPLSTNPEDWSSGDSDLFSNTTDPLLSRFKEDVYFDELV